VAADGKAHASIQRDPAKYGKLIKDEDLIAVNSNDTLRQH
jgi:hypothetical protein